MFLYNLGIYFYAFAVRIFSIFNYKAAEIIKGQKETYDILKSKLEPSSRYIWIHAASLGEFEQGRPIIEEIKRKHPEYKILLTFFSPSGYNVQKNYPLADIVCYLPFDKKKNVEKFLNLITPEKVLFIKYEFWCNYVYELKKREIPVFMVSSIFRSKQIFFKWYGGFMRKLLKQYTNICVQDEASSKLLKNIYIDNIAICGDTRFDRVLTIKNSSKKIDLINSFTTINQDITIIAGSSWPKDEDIFINYFNRNKNLKLIIAPHEIDEDHLKTIENRLKKPHIRYSEANSQNINNYKCVIIDCFGLLSSIYRYGQIAYIGGGFGTGIHNLPEAAVYGLPVIFGPNFEKFREASMLIECGGGFTISNDTDFKLIMEKLTNNPDQLKNASKNAENYIASQTGAINKVMTILGL